MTHFHPSFFQRDRTSSLACWLVVASTACLAGCAFVGPASIKAGRLNYAEAITATDDEQVLQMIVRDRYEERLVPLSVSSVTANIRFTSSVGINAGLGSLAGYEGRLVPLSAGVAFEENPIISYSPVDAPAFLRQLLSPIPLDVALLMLRSAFDRNLAGLVLIERMNGLKNPNSAVHGASPEDFVRAIEILTELITFDLAEFVSLGKKEDFGLLLQVEEIQRLDRQGELIELMRLLELSDLLGEMRWTGELPSGKIAGGDSKEKKAEEDVAEKAPPEEEKDPKDGGLAGADADVVDRSERAVLVISIRFSAVADGSSIAITTRSVLDLVRVAAAAVDVPQEHIDSGMSRRSTLDGLASSLIEIKRAEKRPPGATIATQLHGWWYYVDPNDTSTKQFFRTLSALWSAQIASADSGNSVPLLTVPVSR